MSEEVQQEQTPNTEVPVLKVYIKKQEELIADFCRRLINAEMNLEIATNSFTQAQQRATAAESNFQQILNGLQQITAERNELREQIAAAGVDKEEVIAITKERDRAVKQRDDFYRELQHHISNGNKMAEQVRQLENENKELKFAQSAPPKKVAKVKA